jgi:molecular chaperone IbpA
MNKRTQIEKVIRDYLGDSRDSESFGIAFPWAIGYDQFFNDVFNRLAPVDNYPPYNVIHKGCGEIHIELALAGFDKEDICVSRTGDTLTIKSSDKWNLRIRDAKKKDGDCCVDSESDRVVYLHRGIAARSFALSFKISNKVDIISVKMTNGILCVVMKENEDKLSIEEIEIS